jgi:hypothetical protein
VSDLLRELAALPQIGGSLPVKVLAGAMPDRFGMTRTAASPVVAVVALHDGSDRGRCEAERYARILSSAPAMLDLLAVALLNWGEAVEQDEPIDGGDAIAWIGEFTTEVQKTLAGMVGPQTPETAP